MTETDRRILALQRSIDELNDHNVRQRRMLADLLYNLDEENMPAVKLLIERYQAENGEAVALLKTSAKETAASIESLAAVQTAHSESIAEISQTAGALEAEVASLVSVQTAHSESIAEISQTAGALEAEVASLVSVQTAHGESIAEISQTASTLGSEVLIAAEKAVNAEENANEAMQSVKNGAYIIARVNDDGSLVKIKADKLELSGYVTLVALSEPGKTEIDGANLKTGTVIADRIALNENGQIVLERLGALVFNDPSGAYGEMRISENEFGKGEISLNSDGTVAVGAGGASLMLLDNGSGSTEASLYTDSLRINGMGGISGTFSFGGGSITVANGIVVGVTADGNGDSEPVELYAPEVYLDGEYISFRITNHCGMGTICYQTYWYDNYGNSWESDVYYDDSDSVTGEICEFPGNGGYIGVRAWVEYDGYTGPSASDEAEYA